MDDDRDDVGTELETEAVHEVELGLEWLHRAHGALVQFHHNTGHAMDHLDEAAELLAEAGHDDLAAELRDDLLPQGVVPEEDGPGMWTYELLEAFEGGVYADVREFETAARESVTGGDRHPAEQRLQRAWRERADDGSAESG